MDGSRFDEDEFRREKARLDEQQRLERRRIVRALRQADETVEFKTWRAAGLALLAGFAVGLVIAASAGREEDRE